MYTHINTHTQTQFNTDYRVMGTYTQQYGRILPTECETNEASHKRIHKCLISFI